MCERLEKIREQIEEAATRSGRHASDITLVAVSKKKPPEMVRQLYDCGQWIFGENYIQEGVDKIKELAELDKIQWHFIGHLQRNKVKLAVRYFDWIETVDSLRLARAIDKRAKEIDRRVKVLVQVNIGEEKSKYGVMPQEAAELLEEVASLPNLEVKGLMTIHPFSSSRDEARAWFKGMAKLKRDLSKRFPHIDLSELSMGMSHDFDIAIEEGATIVRVGTALFGPRI